MKSASILMLDTSQRNGWVGFARDAAIIAEVLLDPKRGHARDLTAAIAKLCQDASTKLKELTAIAVNVGPGSFTGIRVALATVKAISLATGVQLVAIDTFDLAARGVGDTLGDFRVVIDFQLNGWLVGDFVRSPDGQHRRGEVSVLPSAESARLRSEVPVCGPGVEKLARQFEKVVRLHVAPWAPSRDAFLALAHERVRASQFADPFALEPVYATISSAEQLWRDRPTSVSE